MWRFAVGALAPLTIALAVSLQGGAAASSNACPVVLQDSGIGPEEEKRWTPCEKWVWSCIRQGKEANLYEQKCLEPRTRENNNAREKWKREPFLNPDNPPYENALSDQFLRTVLWQEEYAKKIHPHGVRIYGGYFKDPVNLENITTSVNLVIDSSVFKDGLRLTNFRTEKNVSFDGSNVRGPILLMRARIDGSLFLEQGVYDGVDLRDTKIGSSIDAARSVFNDDFRMDRARIEGKINLVKSRLTVLNAWDAFIGGSLELRLSDIRVRMDMTGSTVNGDVRMQRLRFGKQREDGAVPSCEWDITAESDYVLGDLLSAFRDDKAAQERILAETVRTRPTMRGRRDPDVCADALKVNRQAAKHEVLLRDMKIKGNLCLIDMTGAIGTASQQLSNLESISLDGTQANSTVLRWQSSDSGTLWRAVNFKTLYMLVNLESQPRRHFIDNMDVGFIAFLRKEPNEPDAKDGDENFDKYLCDVTPGPSNTMSAGSRDVHERLVQFFTGQGNESKSAQPFSKIVERLEESGATSTYLKTELSEYRLAKVCTSSAFSKEWGKLEDLSLRTLSQKLGQTWENVYKNMEIRENSFGVLVESNRLFWDGVCSGGRVVYKYAVSYGHEPYNLFYYALLFVGVFWLLLRLDKLAAAGDQRLGLTYAFDMFVPLAQLRLNRSNASKLPNRPLLRLYLRFHRLAGLVFAVLVFLFIYRAAK